MGYSGGITFNKQRIFSEGKCDGRFCMNYAEAYNKRKSSLLSIKSIDETIGDLHDGVTSYSWTIHEIQSAGDIIKTLASLLKSNYAPYFDEDGNFLLVIKMQNSDSCGNSQNLNFYKADNVSNVPEVDLQQRICLKDEDMNDMKRKRVACIKTISIFSMFSGLEKCLPNRREEYYEYIAAVKNIKTKNDVLVLLAKANECYKMLTEIYERRFNVAMSLTNILNDCKNKIENGGTIRVKCINDSLLCFYGDIDEIEVTVDNFFSVTNLFNSLGTSTWGSGIVIDSIKDFEELLKTFETIEHRSEYIETLLLEKYNYVKTNNESFKLSIGGSY